MLSRLCPSQVSPMCSTPSSSGPRWPMVFNARRNAGSSSGLFRVRPRMAHIHVLSFRLDPREYFVNRGHQPRVVVFGVGTDADEFVRQPHLSFAVTHVQAMTGKQFVPQISRSQLIGQLEQNEI